MDLSLYTKWLDQTKRSLSGFSDQDVEEAFNDALLLIHQQDRVFTNDAHAYSFIKTTTKNKILNINTLTKLYNRKNEAFQEIRDSVDTPLDLIIKKQDIDSRIKLVYKSIDKKQKKIVKAILKGYSRRDISKKLNIKESTVNSQIRHIKHKIGAAW